MLLQDLKVSYYYVFPIYYFSKFIYIYIYIYIIYIYLGRGGVGWGCLNSLAGREGNIDIQ
jgi:hypothetical protein